MALRVVSHGASVLDRVARGETLTVYTCNPDDFGGIDGLPVVAVPLSDE